MHDTPGFVPAVARETSGDDPLGMAPVNERLYGSVFPGINNVVQYIRVYSAICWQIGLVENHIEQQKISVQQAKNVYQSALEKIQLLLTWTNLLQEVPRLPGTNRPYPSGSVPVTLLFESFGSNRAAYLDAVQYRPSLTNGLEFVETRDHGILGNLNQGKLLAEAFDEHAAKHEEYAWLSDVTALETTPERVANLQSVFDLKRPSFKERKAFLAQYFPENKPPNSRSSHAHRWAALLLVLRVIDTLETESYYADEDSIRITMARALCFGGTKIDLSGIELEQQWWAVLQLRQLLRLAMDTLEAVLEQYLDICVHSQRPRSINSICDDIRIQLEQHLESEDGECVSDYIEAMKHEQGNLPSIYHIPIKDSNGKIFEFLSSLRVKIQPDPDGTFPIVTTVFKALIVCAVEAENMLTNKYAREAVEAGAGEGSLADLAESAKEFADQTPGEWLAHLLQHWVINRHFYVATFRSNRAFDGKNRFRFVVGDTGLQRFDMSVAPSGTGVAQDRLNHALLLLDQCGLIKEEGEDIPERTYILTKAGKRRL